MNILTFDIESCTGNTLDGSLCSFGYAFKSGGSVEVKDIVVNPLPHNFTLGHYGKEPVIKLAYPISHFRKQPQFKGRYAEIKGLFEKSDLVLGFAIQNDLKYLNNACDKFNLPRIEFKFLDVQLLAGLVLPELKNHGLKTYAEKFGIEFLEHRSDEDARVTYLVFEKILEISGTTPESVMEKYALICGKNMQDGHINCYSEIEVRSRLESGSKSVKKILINYYAANAPLICEKGGFLLKGKRFCVSESVYGKSVDVARKIIVTGIQQGGVYESSILKCNLFICNTGDKLAERVKKMSVCGCEVIMVNEFISLTGNLTDYQFDDYAALIEHYTQIVTDREVPESNPKRR